MIIKTLNIGSLRVNNYLVICEKTQEAALIDAGGDYQATVNLANENNAKIKYILNTHGHFDHIAGDSELQVKNKVKVFLHKEDESLVESFKNYLMLYDMPDYDPPKVNEFVNDGQEIKVGELNFKVIHTPGHSSGSVSYLIDNVLFSGDTLFAESVGRTDLPGGSYEAIKNSIINKLFVLDDNTIVYPGHGYSTTIGYEKVYNPFFGKNVR